MLVVGVKARGLILVRVVIDRGGRPRRVSQVLINDLGLGGALVFIVGDRVVPMHTAQPEGQPPLVPLEGIQRLAEMVAGRL